MLIISPYKDFYDGVVNTTGIDKTIIYNRQTKEFNRKDKDYPDFLKDSFLKRKKDNVTPIVNLCPYHNLSLKKNILYQNYNYFVIGFCGKQYIGFKFYYQNKTNNVVKYDIIYSYNIVINYFDLEKKYYYHKNDKFEETYNKILKLDTINIFRQYNTPVFVYEDNVSFYKFNNIKLPNNYPKFIINPNLKDFEFYKIFNPYQTLQEIQMFLSGVLGTNEKEIVDIDNKSKILKYGFDLKTSFRKDKNNC